MAPANQGPSKPLAANLLGPAVVPPKGVISNFDDPSNKNSLVRAILILFLIITSVFALSRVYLRFLLKQITIPDILALAALAIYYSFVYLFFQLLDSYGWFVHMWDLRLDDFPHVNRIFWLGFMLYIGDIFFIKSAIILEWVRIFVPGQRNAFWWACYSTLVAYGLFCVIVIIFELLSCHPFERIWNPLVEGSCVDTVAIAVGVSVVNLTFDVVILLLPQRIIWGLQMRTRSKAALSIVFAVGILACVAAAFRLQSSLRFWRSEDTTYTFSSLALWSLAEVTCAFVIFCSPSSPKAIRQLEVKKLATTMKSWADSSVRYLSSPSTSSTSSAFRETRKRSGSNLAQSEPYQMIDESGSMPSVPLDTISRTKVFSTVPDVNNNNNNKNNNNNNNNNVGNSSTGIVRKIHFTAVPGRAADDALLQEEHKRQHPWVNRSYEKAGAGS
ncbi:hypothetical protein GGR56DRAFT_136354 [Xylariaceae sp. FL0804]|nr:hypothetical protein GGR56DRAFT_136354 [Xylariaceae sp. FL0804]